MCRLGGGRVTEPCYVGTMNTERRTLFARWCSAAVVSLLLVAGGDLHTAVARGGAVAPPAGPEPDTKARMGSLYFNQSAAWVGEGTSSSATSSSATSGSAALTDFYADLHDVQFKKGKSSHEVHMRIWLKTPDKYRVEVRRNRAAKDVTTKILSGSHMWIVNPEGLTTRVHGSAEGAATVAQLQRDRKQLMGLANFLTLKGLRGPKVRFVYEGTAVETGLLQGKWLKVRRISPHDPEMVFHFAYERDPHTKALRATYPGVVTIGGDRSSKGRGGSREPTELYLLQKWKRGSQFRFPGLIQAYSREKPRDRMQRFLVAFPSEIRVNTNLRLSLFAPPAKK